MNEPDKDGYVPLTVYLDGVRHVIGKCRIEGNMILGYVDDLGNEKLADILRNNREVPNVSFAFSFNAFKSQLQPAPIPLDENYSPFRMIDQMEAERNKFRSLTYPPTVKRDLRLNDFGPGPGTHPYP